MPKGSIPVLFLVAFLPVGGRGAVYYVDVNSVNPVAPYTNWSNAALTIQDAVDVALGSDEILVAGGTYRTGTRLASGFSNRVFVSKAVNIRSTSGPNSTIIEGVQGNSVTNAVRCAYLMNGASLIGFTLAGGSAPGTGGPGTECGGVLGQSTAAWLSNCVIVGNFQGGAGFVTLLNCNLAGNSTGVDIGGGAKYCILTNCTLSENSSRYEGGAAYQCLMSGCIVSNNQAFSQGGGVMLCTLFNCTLSGNSSRGDGGGAFASTLNECVLTNNLASAGYGGACVGGSLTNCTLINNAATAGGGADGGTLYNCVLVGNTAENGGGALGSTLFNCVVTNNGALYGGGSFLCQASNCIFKSNLASAGGGGAYEGTLRRCTIISNTADFGGGAAAAIMTACAILTNSAFSLGGGVADGALDSCVLMGNTSTTGGGSALFYQNRCLLNNCTLVGNYATNMGGGAVDGILNNCIIYYNDSPTDPNLSSVTNANYCCTVPLPSVGIGHITNAPTFVDLATGNLDLPAGSPLINAGSNSYVTNNFDFLGRPRISGAAIDVGAYEYQFLDPFHAWLQGFGLPPDGSADYLDSDGDGMNNWQEWIAGTIPTNAASVLRIEKTMASFPGPSITVVWQSAINRSYFVQRSMNLAPPTFVTIQTNISGLPGTMTFVDTDPAPGRAYYRIGVHQ